MNLRKYKFQFLIGISVLLTLICLGRFAPSFSRFVKTINNNGVTKVALFQGKSTNLTFDNDQISPQSSVEAKFIVTNIYTNKSNEVATKYTLWLEDMGDLSINYQLYRRINNEPEELIELEEGTDIEGEFLSKEAENHKYRLVLMMNGVNEIPKAERSLGIKALRLHVKSVQID